MQPATGMRQESRRKRTYDSRSDLFCEAISERVARLAFTEGGDERVKL